MSEAAQVAFLTSASDIEAADSHGNTCVLPLPPFVHLSFCFCISCLGQPPVDLVFVRGLSVFFSGFICFVFGVICFFGGLSVFLKGYLFFLGGLSVFFGADLDCFAVYLVF